MGVNEGWKLIAESEELLSGVGYRLEVKFPEELTDDESWAIRLKSNEIQKLLEAIKYRRSPTRAAEKEANRANLLGCFPVGTPIYAEEIPNGYCSEACCEHLPWFKVTTPRGRIVIGWRKRVMHIDWGESDVKTDAQTLFPNEDVTKFGKNIHAWSKGKADEYIRRILAAE